MIKHPRTVEGFEGTLAELANSIGNMTYDQTASFIGELADDITRQADTDLARGRKKLSSELYATAEELYQAKNRMDEAWKICKPYIDNLPDNCNPICSYQ